MIGGRWIAGVALVLLAGSCIAPSVLAEEERGAVLHGPELEWRIGNASDLPGTFVSTELSGRLAAVLRKIVYLFVPGGAYSGAALFDDDTPHFEVISGTWIVKEGTLSLDDGPSATMEVAANGWIRLSGPDGRVILRREHNR